MALSASQKADIGHRYTAAINDRIATRTKAGEKAKADGARYLPAPGSAGAVPEALLPTVAKIIKAHRLPGKVESVEFSDRWNHKHRANLDCLTISMDSGMSVRVTELAHPDFTAVKQAKNRFQQLKSDLCQEVEFLHRQLSPTNVSRFQQHVGRMWAPNSQKEMIAEPALRELIEGFLRASRPAVCKLA